MANKYTDQELASQLKSPGWKHVAGKGEMTASGTLEEMARTAHERRSKGQAPGLIAKIETSMELDMLQIERLWLELGLPI
jgi:hypothetical protein